MPLTTWLEALLVVILHNLNLHGSHPMQHDNNDFLKFRAYVALLAFLGVVLVQVFFLS